MDKSTRTQTQEMTGEVRRMNRTGRAKSGLARANRKKSVSRARVRRVLNWESSLYNDEIPDPDSPELPDESNQREDYR